MSFAQSLLVQIVIKLIKLRVFLFLCDFLALYSVKMKNENVK